MNITASTELPSSWFVSTLQTLIAGRDLSRSQMRAAMEAIISGTTAEMEVAALLVALRMKGENPHEVAEAARVFRGKMIPFETGRPDVLDTSGTGGDGTGSFNISTATAFVVAGAGVPVVKHGNRAVSSRSGSADVLTRLGVKIDGGLAHSKRCLDEAGMAFCFAPSFHPALQFVAGIRRRLGIATLFNCLGPLINPASAPYQITGVGRRELLDLLAGAIADLGTKHALLIYGTDGLDEVSLSAPTLVREIRGHQLSAFEWTADDFGLEPCQLNDLRAENPEESAAIIMRVLEGENSPASRVVIANAAAALLAADHVTTLAVGVEQASESLKSGNAHHVLNQLRRFSTSREGKSDHDQ